MSDRNKYVATITFRVDIEADSKAEAERVAKGCIPNFVHQKSDKFSARFKDGEVSKVGTMAHVKKPDNTAEDTDAED